MKKYNEFFSIFTCRLLMLAGIACMLSLTACGGDEDGSEVPDAPRLANRTVLVYIMAENGLSDFAETGVGGVDSDITEMIAGATAIPDNDHLLVFLDDADSLRNPRIYEIRKADKKQPNRAEVVKEYAMQEDENLCSADPAVLAEVLGYVKKEYAAQSYGLVMWSHGSGWLPSKKIKDSRSIGVDNGNDSSSNKGVEMEISHLAEVLAQFGGVDFIYFDACHMQGIEVAYQLKEVTDYVIGSPAETPGTGARYDRILAPMFAAQADIAGIVNNNYNYYASLYKAYEDSGYDSNRDPYDNCGCVLSAIKCSELTNLADATRVLVQKYASKQTILEVDGSVQRYRGKVTFDDRYPDYYDLNGVMHHIATSAEYASWLAAFNRAIPYKVCTSRWYSSFWDSSSGPWRSIMPEADSPFGGVSMYVPQSSDSGSTYATWNSQMKRTGWYQAVWNGTGW